MVMKELNLNSLYFGGRVWQSVNKLIFNSFFYLVDVVVMKQLIFNSFYIMVGFAGLKKTDCLTVSSLRRV